MKFRYLNSHNDALDYHVASADIREGEDRIRVVAYGRTTGDAEAALLDGLDNADAIDRLGSV